MGRGEKVYVPSCLLANKGASLLPPSIPAAVAAVSPSSVHLIKIHLIWIFFANMVWLLAMTWNIPVCYFNHTHPNGQRIWWLWHWTPPLLDPILRAHVILGGAGGWWKLPGMMDTLDNSSLFFLQMFTQHQLSLKPLSIMPWPPLPSSPPLLVSPSLMNCFLPVMEQGHKATWLIIYCLVLLIDLFWEPG